MCLLVALHHVVPGLPLVLAANRDELYARPAIAMTVLAEGPPRLRGGQDALAGGTWLAVSDGGVIVGLTNKPGTRNAVLRSRGELPLRLATSPTAEAAVALAAESLRGEAYSPAWLFVGDRATLHYLDLTRPGPPGAERLPPGVHVLENSPLAVRTTKTEAVRAAVERLVASGHSDLVEGLFEVLRSHETPPGAPAHRAPCVHTEGYGTRSSLVVSLAASADPPALAWTDGPPCTAAVRRS